MDNRLVELEQKGIRLQNACAFKAAIKFYEEIIHENPNYEFGICFYHLACCQEELGMLEEARKNHKKSIKYDNEDIIRLGGFASFLYLHGDSKEAFDVYLSLFKLEKKQGKKVDDLIIALKTLGKKISLSEQEIMERIFEN